MTEVAPNGGALKSGIFERLCCPFRVLLTIIGQHDVLTGRHATNDCQTDATGNYQNGCILNHTKSIIVFVSQSLNQLGRDSANNGIRLHVLGHYRSSTDNSIFTDCHARQNGCSCTYPAVPL